MARDSEGLDTAIPLRHFQICVCVCGDAVDLRL